jgi:nucleoside-diphosphate-sugar epimerase
LSLLTLAVTGATGFVGSHLLDLALAAGHQVRALTRRPQPIRDGVTWVDGALDKPDSLATLCSGADAVLHVAGVINAPDPAGFEAGNVTGTAAMLAAATGARVKRFVHVSSLSAREPGLSQYGASKARSETKVRTAAIDWAIVRPPAVYGPGDRETLELFKMAKRGLVLLPPSGSLSVIHAEDLADLLLATLLAAAPSGLTIEPDDGHAGGYSHRAFATLLAAAFGKSAATLAAPAPLVRAAAWLDGMVRGDGAKLTPDRARHFCHPDWVIDPARAAPPTLWRPRIPTPQGVADTARWYEREGWL